VSGDWGASGGGSRRAPTPRPARWGACRTGAAQAAFPPVAGRAFHPPGSRGVTRARPTPRLGRRNGSGSRRTRGDERAAPAPGWPGAAPGGASGMTGGSGRDPPAAGPGGAGGQAGASLGGDRSSPRSCWRPREGMRGHAQVASGQLARSGSVPQRRRAAAAIGRASTIGSLAAVADCPLAAPAALAAIRTGRSSPVTDLTVSADRSARAACASAPGRGAAHPSNRQNWRAGRRRRRGEIAHHWRARNARVRRRRARAERRGSMVRDALGRGAGGRSARGGAGGRTPAAGERRRRGDRGRSAGLADHADDLAERLRGFVYARRAGLRRTAVGRRRAIEELLIPAPRRRIRRSSRGRCIPASRQRAASAGARPPAGARAQRALQVGSGPGARKRPPCREAPDCRGGGDRAPGPRTPPGPVLARGVPRPGGCVEGRRPPTTW
jgi:hypothetical protein